MSINPNRPRRSTSSLGPPPLTRAGLANLPTNTANPLPVLATGNGNDPNGMRNYPNTAPGRRNWRSVRLELATWRGQALGLAGLVAIGALVALLVAFSTTNSQITRFQELASVAVPAIDATNEATQLLASEVANSADYILADQTSSGADRRQTILKQIEQERARYDLALQANYKAVISYGGTIQPKADMALSYLSTYNARLHDALAQARGLVDSKNPTGATQAYLSGQNAYYQPVISTLYFLRSVHIFQLEDAASDANSAATIQQYLALAATLLFVVLLLLTNLWLTFKVKRVLIPLLNLALVAGVAYSLFLWIVFSNTASNLKTMQTSYDNTTTVTDAGLYLTNARADQVQGVIGGQPASTDAPANSPRFVTDPVYDQDFATRLEQLLAVKNPTTGLISSDPKTIPDCPASASDRRNYKPVGALADLCRRLTASQSDQVTALNQFIGTYRSWLDNNTNFRNLLTSGRNGDALNLRAGDGSTSYNTLSDKLNQIKQLNVNTYQANSKSGTDSLNLALLFAWIVYLGGLGLAEIGLFIWRQEF